MEEIFEIKVMVFWGGLLDSENMCLVAGVRSPGYAHDLCMVSSWLQAEWSLFRSLVLEVLSHLSPEASQHGQL